MGIKITVDLQHGVREYGMFTDLGNAAVHAIVEKARAEKMTWSQTCCALRALAKQDEFGEAMDTAVREYVYDALDFRNEDFYI